jgi:hypothetical protein
MSLVLAQERRDAARQLAAAGQDPSEARKTEKADRRQQLAHAKSGPLGAATTARSTWTSAVS